MAKSNVVKLRLRNSKPAPEHDSVFFTKDQIKVGTRLAYVGRQNPDDWIVTKIISHETGSWRPQRVSQVRFLSDRIFYRRASSGPYGAERSATFSYLSYSAIWRIA